MTPAPPGGSNPGCGTGKITASSTGGVLTVASAGQSATDTVTIHNTLAQSFSDAGYLFAIAPSPTKSTPHTAPVVARSLNGSSYVNLPLSWHSDGWTTQRQTFALGAHATATLKLRVTFKTGAWPGRYVSLIQTGLTSCDDPSATVSGNGFAFTATATPTPTATTSTTATPSAPASAGAPSEIAGITGLGGTATPSGASSVAGQGVDAANPTASHSGFLLIGLGLIGAFALAALIVIVLVRRRRREDDEGDGRVPTSGPDDGRGQGYGDFGGYGDRTYAGFGGGGPADATAVVFGDLPARSPGFPASYDDPYRTTTYNYPEELPTRRGYTGASPEVRPPAYGQSGYPANGGPAYGAPYSGDPGYGVPTGYDPAPHDPGPYHPGSYNPTEYTPSGYGPSEYGYDAAPPQVPGQRAPSDPVGYQPRPTEHYQPAGGGYDGPGFGAQDPRWGEVAEPEAAPEHRQPYEAAQPYDEGMIEHRGRHGAAGDPADEPGSVNGWQGDGYGGYPDESWGYQPR